MILIFAVYVHEWREVIDSEVVGSKSDKMTVCRVVQRTVGVIY